MNKQGIQKLASRQCVEYEYKPSLVVIPTEIMQVQSNVFALSEINYLLQLLAIVFILLRNKVNAKDQSVIMKPVIIKITCQIHLKYLTEASYIALNKTSYKYNKLIMFSMI